MRFPRKPGRRPRSLGVLSSAFHPPARAHLALAHAALDLFETEQVLASGRGTIFINAVSA